MTFESFGRMREIDQLNVLITEAYPIGESTDLQHHLFLYMVNDFYVTVTYCRRTEKLLSIRQFTHYGRKLMPIPVQNSDQPQQLQ